MVEFQDKYIWCIGRIWVDDQVIYNCLCEEVDVVCQKLCESGYSGVEYDQLC